MTNASLTNIEGFISVVKSADKLWKTFFLKSEYNYNPGIQTAKLRKYSALFILS